MTVLIVILAVLAFFFLISLIRVGVSASYSLDGAEAAAFVGPVKIRLYPKKEKGGRREKKPKKKDDAVKTEKKGGSIGQIMQLLPAIGDALGEFRRKLVIDDLRVRYSAAADDPYKAAMGFGCASAGMGTLTALIRSLFKVRNLDMVSGVSFEETDPSVSIDAKLSLGVGQLAIIAVKFLIYFIKSSKNADNAKI